MSRTQKDKDLDDDPDYAFINATIAYNPSYGNAPCPATLNINKSIPIVNHIENFYVSVGRVQIPSYTLPMLTAPLVVGSNYSDLKMTYSFTLSYDGVDSDKQNVTWIATNVYAELPTGTVTTSLQSQYPYFWNYTFWTLCQMFNNALQIAFNDLNSKTILPVGSAAPSFYFDNSTYKLVLKTQQANYNLNSTPAIYIWFNNDLAPLFVNFDYIRFTSNSPGGKDNYFAINNNGTNTISGDTTYFYNTPYSMDTSYYSSIASLQVITTLPIVNEAVQQYNPNYGQFSTQLVIPQLNPQSPILTDFIPDYSIQGNFGTNWIYNKTDNWRYSDTSGYGYVNTFDISFAWTDLSGLQQILQLLPNTAGSIKIGFFKKSLLNTESEKILEQFKKKLFS